MQPAVISSRRWKYGAGTQPTVFTIKGGWVRLALLRYFYVHLNIHTFTIQEIYLFIWYGLFKVKENVLVS